MFATLFPVAASPAFASAGFASPSSLHPMRSLHGRGLHALAFASGGASRASLFATPADAPADIWLPEVPEAELGPKPEAALLAAASFPPVDALGAAPPAGNPSPAPLDADAGEAHRARAHCSPNPFVTSTAVVFDLPQAARVEVIVHDANGGAVRRLADGTSFPAGTHHVRWDGRDDFGREVESGTYFVRLRLAH
jgi:hypothetical protein